MADDLVLEAMRLAERAHRQANHFRKAPLGEDRPAYFLHLCEVAWMLQSAGSDPETTAAGFLHDVIEDCDYTEERLAEEIGSERVAILVSWVSEPDRGNSWQTRNQAYLTRIRTAPREALMISCADKTSNLGDTLRLVRKGYLIESFLSVGKDEQLAKFERLSRVFEGQVPGSMFHRFRERVDLLHQT